MPKVTLPDINKKPDYIPVDGYEAQCHLDSKPFKEYRDQVAALFTDRPLCTRDIHEALGYEKRHWTLDAIESTSGLVEVGVCPTRWMRSEYKAVGVPWHKLGLFPSRPADKHKPMAASVYHFKSI